MKIYLGFIDNPYDEHTIDYVMQTWYPDTYKDCSLIPSLVTAANEWEELMYFDTNRLVMRLY